MAITKKKGESTTKAATVQSAKKTQAKHESSDTKAASNKSGGLDEIESLFAEKKKHKQETAAKQQQQQHDAKKKQKQKKSPARASSSTTDWVNDGLGGRFNSEGYTGRVEDGMKIFKTHLLQSTKSGSTPDCPFDCNCCFI
ncbi:expressed unknown protein [Seminavis robusta]|uniref:Uncharacterized protein n=1 Tax=Seminavis robusta TaxID=568900 RepID=A0A9N8EX66_9STRA|nr:expressed unknown protein [Seminavis robusta]|eukprot:Sro2218_g319540.1 n/a (141) ;mRNA; f:10829-11251